MDAPNTTDWIQAIATIVIPIVSVVLAQRVTTEHYRAIATMDLLRNIVLHCQQLKHEMLDMFQAKCACKKIRGLNEQNNNSKKRIIQGIKNGEASLNAHLEQAHEHEKSILMHIQIQDEIFASSFKRGRQIEAQIDTDILTLGFLLQTKGSKCGEALRKYLRFFISYTYTTACQEDFNDFQQEIHNRICAVVDEVTKLQKASIQDDS
ncbi:hypothetical protein Psta_0451 [Pirellula staleyi DSM 6068]|uniref:Uncharacterized protein n=1 Tax=Pirellula staleyi (strain ATCC 27377 / DSM 6068 / ICPB 4128) TaxID=530564 RepID=D2R3A8_PIRSD|nr:hypothetical protein [Pirellula staleyi]ADB15139.1 hypothetical protein Psta_0451 [Pirellula staleyi DSM 6068]